MRFTTALITLLAVAGGSVSAADSEANYEKLRHNAGVGLGTMLWSHVGTGLFPQVCAVTTNSVFANQTFAITSGTSGADKWDSIVRNESVNEYIAGNMDALARDIAVGSGESITALADLLNVAAERRTDFAAALKANHAVIFSGAAVTADQVVQRIADVAVAV
jgi:hypothetical protein